MLFMDADQIKARVDEAIAMLTQLRDSLDEPVPAMPEEALKRLKKGLCLYCGEAFEKSEKDRRGCHNRCYQLINRAIKDSPLTDELAIAKGMWTPKKTGGRPTKISPIHTLPGKGTGQGFAPTTSATSRQENPYADPAEAADTEREAKKRSVKKQVTGAKKSASTKNAKRNSS